MMICRVWVGLLQIFTELHTKNTQTDKKLIISVLNSKVLTQKTILGEVIILTSPLHGSLMINLEEIRFQMGKRINKILALITNSMGKLWLQQLSQVNIMQLIIIILAIQILLYLNILQQIMKKLHVLV